jgi:succinate dehydrogenase / fumarate reductase flavoprotein subunit
MQGLADGYFILPYTIGDYLAGAKLDTVDTGHAAFREAETRASKQLSALLAIDGTRSVDSFHKELGHVLWNECGMERNRGGLQRALQRIPEIRAEFWKNVRVPGSAATLNQSLEKAGRVADFLEFGELICLDALQREESCGGHFRTEYQTPDGEARRNDAEFTHVAVWEYRGSDDAPTRHIEPLDFEFVKLATRSYK